MTSYFSVPSSNKQAPTFMVTLDGQQYNMTIIWNISARRYYIRCNAIDGTLIFFVPIVNTLTAFDLTAIEYDQQNSRVIATSDEPIPFDIGSVFVASVINTEPTGYNGTGLASVLSKNEFIYNIPSNPGLATTLGDVQFLVSLTQGYFASTMIYRNSQFEVNP